MNAKWAITPFKVGLLVIIGVIAAAFMYGVLEEGVGGGGGGQTELHAFMNDATGLAAKVRIQMSGIPVGQIDKISLEDGRARVDFTVRKEIKVFEGLEEKTEDGKTVWKNGATLAKKQASFIGDYYLEITPGTEGDLLEDGDELKNVIEAVGFDQIVDRLDRIAEDVEQVTSSMAAVFGGDEGQKAIQDIVADLGGILETLNTFVGENSGKLDRIVSNVEDITVEARMLTANGSDSIERILRDSEAIVQEVRYMIGQSSSDVQSGLGTLKGTLSRLQSTLDSLNYSLQNIQDITDKINEGEGTLGELVNNPTIAQKTEEILEDASQFVNQLSRLKTIIDLRSEYHLQSEQLKNVLGLRLQPTPDKYYLIELVDDFRGKTEIQRRTVNTNEAGESDTLYTETEVVTRDEFKVSVEFAKSFFLTPWFGITGRFGLIESSGGIGADFVLLNNRNLEITNDLFDFGEDVNPRFRSFATFRFLSFVYIAGGVDDILNPTRRDVFLGGGIRFDDEDLKAILTTTGVPGG